MSEAMRWAAHEPVTLSQQMVLAIILVCFGLMGWRRGVNRELVLFIGIVLAFWIVQEAGPTLHVWVNRFYRLGRFALQGGLTSDDPTVAWQKVKESPDLIQGEEAASRLIFIAFVVIVLCFFTIGQRFAAPAKGRMLNILGAVVGGINGFLVASIILPRLVPSDTTMTIKVPTQAVVDLLADATSFGLLAVFFVGTMIALGLYKASGKK